MSAPIKDFAALKSLQSKLKTQEEERKAKEAERLRREKQHRLDADLFRQSIGNVTPVSSSQRAPAPASRPLPIARHRLADEQAALQESLSDEFNVDTLLDTDQELSFSRPGIGPEIVRKLRRGHWVVQGQLDLHGMRREEAREALVEFLRNAVKRGQRCVRIIHGKGLGSINKEPVLKGKVRNWLVQKEEVIAFCQARANDGGAGALIVLLKA
ncbi:DNA mismatch repair protein MutS [Noviherbaspirillum cavernae]|uniref:DNA mismatch repair protein MutS n=1 Tax=Noviherbaspirillum cavernae TaxID=2320862 RepID=A0A418WZK3_9BURK|nr:Smr/MutS family protein [Noviherbaspirillum cavernae]RJG05659.1 DNA mismatch repair protein MutS [Noviherbaspirillum cavernae]